ncbi:hypothetical protein V3C99_003448 [Haemonchus contortus]
MATASEDIGLIQSDYVINQINDSADQSNENETALGERPTAIRSQYMDEKMRSFLTVSANRNYQDHPSAVRRVPLMGKPISSNELRSRVNTLDTTVYSPMIIDGKLYFVDQNDDVRTARSSNSMESTKTAQSIPYINDDDITFTLSELKTLLPRSAISDLMRYYEEHMKVKRISSEDQAIIKLENALHVLKEFSDRHVPNHPALVPVDLETTDDPVLQQLCKPNTLTSEFKPVPATNVMAHSYTSDSENLSSSITGDVSSVSTPFSSLSSYIRGNGETMMTMETAVEPGASQHEGVTTARPHSLVTAALPSDSTHTATSSTELFNFNTARSPNETTAVPINLEEEKKDAITGQDYTSTGTYATVSPTASDTWNKLDTLLTAKSISPQSLRILSTTRWAFETEDALTALPFENRDMSS